MIRLASVTKRFGRFTALVGVSFEVAAGEVVGFLGPNGAGKTTALRIIAGYLDADGGRVEVAGHDLAVERRLAQARLGYLPEAVPLHGDMRLVEYLRFRARLKGLARRAIAGRVDAVCEQLRLGERRRQLIGTLSRGFRQRVGLADALLAEPAVLLLDEPTTGLDPMQARELRGLLGELGRERAVLLSSHALGEVEASCGRVIVLARGRVVADAAPAALPAAAGLAAGAGLEEAFVRLVAGASDEPDEARRA
jgi:ABC-2 type transport system ATP-binding protein